MKWMLVKKYVNIKVQDTLRSKVQKRIQVVNSLIDNIKMKQREVG